MSFCVSIHMHTTVTLWLKPLTQAQGNLGSRLRCVLALWPGHSWANPERPEAASVPPKSTPALATMQPYQPARDDIRFKMNVRRQAACLDLPHALLQMSQQELKRVAIHAHTKADQLTCLSQLVQIYDICEDVCHTAAEAKALVVHTGEPWSVRLITAPPWVAAAVSALLKVLAGESSLLVAEEDWQLF